MSFQCPMDWEGMEGGEASRFCGKCRQRVVDLSAMTVEEAEGFVRENGSGGGACVRLMRRADGSLVTKGCPKSLEAKARVARTVLAGAATGLALASCATAPDCGGAIEPEGNAGFAEAPEEKEDFPILLGVMCVEEERSIL